MDHTTSISTQPEAKITMSESWRERIHEPVVIIEGDDELFRGQVCITANTRYGARTLLGRVVYQIHKMLDIHFQVRMEATRELWDLINDRPYSERPKPPKFSWKGIPGKL